MEQTAKLVVNRKISILMFSKIFTQNIVYQNQFPFPYYLFFFLFETVFRYFLNIQRFLEEYSQHIPPGVSSFMWLLKFALLWHRRFLSALINALF